MIPLHKRLTTKAVLRSLLGLFLVAVVGLTAWHFPRKTDAVATRDISDADYLAFYEKSYAPSTSSATPDHSGEPTAGPRVRRSYEIESCSPGAADNPVIERIREFVQKYGLQHKRILEVGAGSGYLQDVVEDYTGLDISSTAARFFHKPFVQASATNLPFPDSSFDVVWTITVLEHVPKPEQALLEMRRVVKDGGYIYLEPAWQCRTWAAEGYAARPYSDFDLKGKIIKASIPIRDSVIFRSLYIFPIRLLRASYAVITGTPTAFRYNELSPNYKYYWVPDGDAVNSMDGFEAMLWFGTRGDEILNYPSAVRRFFFRHGAVIIRVRKGRSG
jgi:SAM-dependent methyltransferase